MTHEELLTEIDKYFIGEHSNATAMLNFGEAIRTVVKLHSEQEVTLPDGEWGILCSHCSEYDVYVLYPCKTIKAIEKELGDV